jgi:hypothetical protein
MVEVFASAGDLLSRLTFRSPKPWPDRETIGDISSS